LTTVIEDIVFVPTTGRRPRTGVLTAPGIGLTLLLSVTALAYLWKLGDSGWANAYYSAAVQAATQSPKAFFFGSLDAGNLITVDKTPASLWLMDVSALLFGVNSWSILVPQALLGVASVGLLYLAVRRPYGPVAGLIAGAVLAATPVAALMFRYNNPDALLTFLLVAAAYATTRAIERAGTRWLVLAGALVGFAFLAKMLQAFLVLPALALAYLIGAPAGAARKTRDVLIATGALVVAGGWWVAVVELWPASSRPYIGGSQHNSVLELALGYNGLGRLDGSETGSVSGGRGWGETGLVRLFNSEMGGQASWLLPAALILLTAAAWYLRDRRKQLAGVALWGVWLVVTGLVFSYMQGIIHPYYLVALAPAIGALAGLGAVTAWRHRLAGGLWWLAAAIAASAGWSARLLLRTPDWHPWLLPVVLSVGLLAAAAVAALAAWRSSQEPDRLRVGLLGLGLAAALAGPVGYTVDTVTTAHTGAIPSAGPAGAFGLAAGGPGGPPAGGPGLPNTFGVQASGAFPGGRNRNQSTFGAGLRGGPGGLLDARTPGADLVAALQSDAARYTWVAAAVGANNAAGYQLATGAPVMALGGFNGSDPAPTLAQFQAYVAAGRVHYFIAGSLMAADSGSDTASEISRWVSDTFAATTIAGATVYDLTAG
jgi:4-amino-4-deoxy-L-arabinose transferase-like glycosyltransferase